MTTPEKEKPPAATRGENETDDFTGVSRRLDIGKLLALGPRDWSKPRTPEREAELRACWIEEPLTKPTEQHAPIILSDDVDVEFDRNRSVVIVGKHEIDLTKIQPAKERGKFHWPVPRFDSLPHGVRSGIIDAVEEAAWEVFASRRFWRAEITGQKTVLFDFFRLIETGHRFDWTLGVVHPPGSATSAESRIVRGVFDVNPPVDRSDELILDDYLTKTGSMLIAGQAGVGKSSLGMQLAVGWSLGREVLGFRPARPLASLIIQAENSDRDLAKMRNGVCYGMILHPDDEELVNEFVGAVRVDEVTGVEFGIELRKMIGFWNPDVVFLDPLLAFVGGDLAKQEIASHFLRQVLQPIARESGVAFVLLHHVGKPKQDDRGEIPLADYVSFGSSELANWPRAIAAIFRTKERGFFRMDLGKRGQNLGWRSDNGDTVFSKILRHSREGIHWEEVSETEQAKQAIAQAPTKEALLALVPEDGTPVAKAALISRAKDAHGMGLNKAEGYLAELIEERRLHLWHVPRPRTNPQRMVSRVPQPQPSPQ